MTLQVGEQVIRISNWTEIFRAKVSLGNSEPG